MWNRRGGGRRREYRVDLEVPVLARLGKIDFHPFVGDFEFMEDDVDAGSVGASKGRVESEFGAGGAVGLVGFGGGGGLNGHGCFFPFFCFGLEGKR